MFQGIFQRSSNPREIKKEDTPNVDYLVAYEGGKSVDPGSIAKQFQRLDAAKQNSSDVVKATLRTTCTWLKSVGLLKPQAHLYARKEKIRSSGDQEEKTVIVLYEDEVSNWSIIAFFQNYFRKKNAELGKKVFADLYASIAAHGIEKNDDYNAFGAKELGVLLNCDGPLNVGELRETMNCYQDTSENSDPQQKRDFNTISQLPESNNEYESSRTDVLQPEKASALASKNDDILEEENLNDEPDGSSDMDEAGAFLDNIITASAAPETGNAETGTPAALSLNKNKCGEKSTWEETANITTGSDSSKKPTKKSIYKTAEILEPEWEAPPHQPIKLGKKIDTTDWRNADMLVLSPSGFEFADSAISDSLIDNWPYKNGRKAQGDLEAFPITSSAKRCFLVPLEEMAEITQIESNPSEIVSGIDELWESISEMAAKNKIKTLVAVPSYPLCSDPIIGNMLAKAMVSALVRKFEDLTEVNIKLVPRTDNEQQALEKAIARLNNAGAGMRQ